jgi:DNA mismatch repair protein MutS2
VDEALPVVDTFIDRALLDNLDTVTIIHGSGSGRLRNAIRDFLKEHRAVTGFGHGDPLHGGLGVTVVQLGLDQTAASSGQHDDHARFG